MACQDPKRPDGKLPEVPGRKAVARGFVKGNRCVPGRKLTAIEGKIGWEEKNGAGAREGEELWGETGPSNALPRDTGDAATRPGH